MQVAALLLIVFGLEAAASYFVKQWVADSTLYGRLIVGTLLYGASVLTWAFALRNIELYRAVLLYAVGSSVLYLVIGHYGYGEEVSGSQGLGAVFGILCLIFLAR